MLFRSLSNGNAYKIKKVVAQNRENDFILFQVESSTKDFNYIPIARDTPKVGETAYAIGSPLGLENTFSSGMISQVRDNNRLQISVPITNGSSGGALLNKYGEVVGITTSGMGTADLNFAVNIKVIKPYLK